jgi:hypothetical protein
MYRATAKVRIFQEWDPHRTSPFGLIARWCDALISRVPEGYQDKGGFHFGVQPALNQPDQPLAK